MKQKIKTAADFGITFTGRQLEEFDRLYCKQMYSKNPTVRSKVLSLLFTFSAAGLCIWMLAANLSSLPLMLIMMIPPVIGAVIGIRSLFEKDRAICAQLYCFAALTMFLVLLNTYLYVFGTEKFYYISNDRLMSAGGEGYMPLYIILTVITTLGIPAGLSRWGRMNMKLTENGTRAKDGKPDYGLISLVSVSAFVITRNIIAALSGRADVKFTLLAVVMVIMFAMFGYFLGLAAGNVRYLRFLGRSGKKYPSPDGQQTSTEES